MQRQNAIAAARWAKAVRASGRSNLTNRTIVLKYSLAASVCTGLPHAIWPTTPGDRTAKNNYRYRTIAGTGFALAEHQG